MPQTSHLWFWLIFSTLFIGTIYLLSPVLAPFLFAAVLAYLGDPLIDRLEARKIERERAVAMVFGALIAILLLLVLVLVPLSAHQFKVMVKRLPLYIDWLQNSILPWIETNLGIDPQVFEFEALRSKILDYSKEIGTVAVSLLESLRTSSSVIFTWIAHLILVPMVTFYLLRDWDIMIGKIQELLPRRIVSPITVLAREADMVVGAFLRGQLIIMAVLSVIYSIGLALIGLEYPLLIGALAGLLSFVPYVGLVVGIAVASISAILEFHSLLSVVPVLVLFGIGQVINDFVLTPKLVGERIGLHPVTVLFAVLAGGYLFGFFGILLSLPVAAVLMVLLRRARDEYLASRFYLGDSLHNTDRSILP